MPEWAIYVLVAIMWLIGTGLVIAFVLIMYFVFGKQLKKLGFHVSVKDGIGVDVETHQPQTYITHSIEPQKAISAESLSVEKETPHPEQANVVPPKLPAKSTNSISKNGIENRVKKILEVLNGQEFSGTLFGKKVKTSGTILPYDERITFFHFEKVFFLSKTPNMPMDILAESKGVGVEVESCKKELFSSFDYDCSTEEYTSLYAICLPNMPNNYGLWFESLAKKLSLLNRESLIWVVISGNFPESIRYQYQNPRILTSSLTDIEVLELELGLHRGL